ncbi:MAG: translocation/assembly module TamB domain-containing protein [Thermoanaerobaculaceae bacterium]|nr:translocation/assembly module TamB domain-containing protein [Thermoanaerobaculaceae bacterium]
MGRRRPHLSRTTVGVLLALTVWLVLLGQFVEFLRYPGVRRWLAHVAAERLGAAIGTPVAVGDVRIALYPPRIVLLDVRVGESGREVFTARVAETTLSRLDLGDRELVLSFLRLDGVRVKARGFGGGGERGAGWLHVIVRQLELHDVAVEDLTLPDGITLRASGVEGRWTGTNRWPVSAATLHAANVTVEIPGLAPFGGAVSGWGRLTADGWEIHKLRGAGAGWKVEGSLASAKGTLSGGGSVGVDLAALDRTVGAAAGMAGWLDATVRVTADPSLRVALDWATPAAEVAGFRVEAARGDLEISADGIEGSLQESRFAGGSLEGSYRLVGLEAPWSHRVAMRGHGVVLAEFLHQLGVGDGGLAARCEVNAEVGWEGRRIGSGEGTAVADLAAVPGDVPVEGRVIMQLAAPAAIRFDARALTVAGAPVAWGGTLSLGSWIPHWQLRGEGVAVSVIGRMLRDWVGGEVFPPELAGEVALDLALHGPFTALRVVGEAAVAPVVFGSLEADSLVGQFTVANGAVTVDGATLAVGKGRVSVGGQLFLESEPTVALRFEGRGVPLARVARWTGVAAPVEGAVNFTGQLEGALARPEGVVSLALDRVSVAGADFGSGSGLVTIGGGAVRFEHVAVGPFSADIEVDFLRCQASVSAELAGFALERLSPPLARLLGGALDCSLRGAFPFEAPSGRLLVSTAGGARGEVELSRDGLHLEVERPGVWRVASQLSGKGSSFRGRATFAVDSWRALAGEIGGGAVLVDGTLRGEADVQLAPSQPLRLEGVITEARLLTEGGTAVLVEPAPFSVLGGAVSLRNATLQGPDMALSVSLARTAGGELTGRIVGDLPAELLGVLWREGQPRGQVWLEAAIGGRDAAPEISGTAEIRNGALTVPGVPGRITRISGTAALVNDAVELEGVQFLALGGHGSCSGKVSFSPQLELDLDLDVKSVRWPLAPGLTPTVSGSVRLVGPVASLVLSGQGVVESTYYRRDVSLQRLILDALAAPEREVLEEEGAVALNLSFDVPGTLIIENAMARLALDGSLRITGTSSSPGVVGELAARPGGEVTLAGVRYEVDRAVVTFSNPRRIDPYLDVLLHGTVEFWEVTAGVQGTLERLTPTLSSSPPLPESDILSLMSVGKAPQKNGVGEGQMVAGGLLLEQFTGAVTGRARTLLDLDQLRLDPAALTQSGDPTARVTVVKQLSPNWSVTLSTNLASNREEIIVSRWRLAPGVYLEAMRDSDSSYSMEVKWRRRY